MHMLAYGGRELPLTPRIVGRRGGYRSLGVVHGLGPAGRRRPPHRSDYSDGSGLSPNPSAAAFRSSDFSRFAFIFASYSSIDCTTYSWPYLSIR